MSAAIKERMPIAEASALARELEDLLKPSCLRIEVAGSIRRGIQLVSDLDLVCVPKLEPSVVTDMFGPTTGPIVDLLDAAIEALYAGGLIEKRLTSAGNVSSWGPKAKRASFRGLSVDVNTVEASTFGAWMVIKTGPHPFSQAIVTPKGQKAAIRNREGKVIAYRDGLLPRDCQFRDGFQLYRDNERVPTPEEADVFRALGMAWREPEARR